MFKKSGAFALIFFLLSITILIADDSESQWKGRWDIGIWSGGGKAVNGRKAIKDTNLFITGVKVGKVLTETHGNGALRGNLEYVLEAIPLFVIFQDKTTSGFDLTPFLMKWNFMSRQNRPTTFLEWGAGTLITSSQFPANTSRFNFTPQIGFGFYLSSNPKRSPTLEVKYIHISNAGFGDHNPGINTLHVLLGYRWLH